MNLRNQIHELRKKQNLSQEQLAEKVGVARQTISKWETGETAPDIKQAQILSQIFDVNLDELVGNDTKHSTRNEYNCEKRRCVPWRKNIIISVAVLFICLAIVSLFGVIKRSQILHPEGLEKNVVITRKSPVRIGNHSAKTVVFSEKNKPMIICELPEGFAADAESSGFYTDGDGNYIRFNADYSDIVVNPLFGTPYYSYYIEHGYDSYIEMAQAAMCSDYTKLTIFSSKEELYMVGGAQLIRQQLCAEHDADYYAISSELMGNGDEMRIHGFALCFNNATWQIVLKDFEDNYYFITIKDPNGVGESIDTVIEFISYIYAGNAVRYSNALDSTALQAARNAFTEYMLEHAHDSEIPEYFVFKADNTRFVSIHDGGTMRVHYSVEAALSAMLADPDPSKLTATDINDLWRYDETFN